MTLEQISPDVTFQNLLDGSNRKMSYGAIIWKAGVKQGGIEQPNILAPFSSNFFFQVFSFVLLFVSFQYGLFIKNFSCIALHMHQPL